MKFKRSSHEYCKIIIKSELFKTVVIVLKGLPDYVVIAVTNVKLDKIVWFGFN